jgi:hypothetical protein
MSASVMLLPPPPVPPPPVPVSSPQPTSVAIDAARDTSTQPPNLDKDIDIPLGPGRALELRKIMKVTINNGKVGQEYVECHFQLH